MTCYILSLYYIYLECLCLVFIWMYGAIYLYVHLLVFIITRVVSHLARSDTPNITLIVSRLARIDTPNIT